MTDKAIEKLAEIICQDLNPMEIAEAVRAAIQADPMGYLEVKPICWLNNGVNFNAYALGVTYNIHCLGGTYALGIRCPMRGDVHSTYGTLDLAKAAAQTHPKRYRK